MIGITVIPILDRTNRFLIDKSLTYPEICCMIYPDLTGSETPTSRIRGENEWGTTASKYPIGSVLGDDKNPY
ncbi:hypothetical protein J14TS2_32160 [Bacillus sp. J14TS2]|nr:hypothetical protein J14TS2_32160 [Bacillus sp. J14TS2]